MKTNTNLKAGAVVDYYSPGEPQLNHNETLVRDGVKVATNLKAGIFDLFRRPRPNHNETLVYDGVRRSVKVATGLKAGGKRLNHNQTLVRDGVNQRVKVTTGVKAGTKIEDGRRR